LKELLGDWCRIVLGEDKPFLEITPEVIKAYGSALQHGHKHIYQAMPRMLTVWFEYGNHNVQTKHKSNKV
jgi:serine/threonine-protein kinase ATR